MKDMKTVTKIIIGVLVLLVIYVVALLLGLIPR
jgi:hypothetical protein